jgi:hypothetical protein
MYSDADLMLLQRLHNKSVHSTWLLSQVYAYTTKEMKWGCQGHLTLFPLLQVTGLHHADDLSIASNLKRSNDSDRIWGHGIGSLCAPGGAVGIGKLIEQ